jgi:hypothetical protein
MFSRKQPKSFPGTVGAGLPYEVDFERAIEAPDSVMDNLEKMRPMIQDIAQMAEMPGWVKYIRPFLERKRDTSRLLQLIEEGKDARVEAAQIKAYGAILNLVGSMARTKDSLNSVAAAKAKEKEVADALRSEEEGK